MPAMIVSNVADGTVREVTDGRPTPGFGLKWSLNSMDPVVRTHTDFHLKNHDKGYSDKEFYGGQ